MNDIVPPGSLRDLESVSVAANNLLNSVWSKPFPSE